MQMQMQMTGSLHWPSGCPVSTEGFCHEKKTCELFLHIYTEGFNLHVIFAANLHPVCQPVHDAKSQ